MTIVTVQALLPRSVEKYANSFHGVGWSAWHTPRVPDVAAALFGAGVVFAATNLDDLVVLAVLFRAAGTGGPLSRRGIVVGQYLGIGVLVGAGAMVAAGLVRVDGRVVGVLGLVPLGLGVRGLWRARGGREPEVLASVAGVGGVALLTCANGADNLGVYVPWFRDRGAGAVVAFVVVSLVLVGVWCVGGIWLAGRRPVVVVLDRWGRWLVPLVFVVLGVAVLVEAGTIGWVLGE